ncbi:hypothetical protein [Cupriavidus sp. UME77]|uniref:hypothetical protein n=1 Tax=Cupriavidus sp. UME77 TaxID=1862321 RepID=UPI0015FF44C3|nr:hypothetical protein [Cupriavidus sp. UME77]MBB1636089.1 hypothetical protein [Cupriavidus sp. UME77]
MKTFVVIDDAMRGVQFVSVHRERPNVGSGNSVLEVGVVGRQTDPEIVYIAQTYDRSMDAHNFAGVYGNYDDARSASGQKGSPLQKKI